MPVSRANVNKHTVAVKLRINTEICSLIDRAAEATGKTRSEFMIDAARRAAEDSVLDQVLVRVDQATYNLYLEVLDQPPSSPGFDRLMRASKPWT